MSIVPMFDVMPVTGTWRNEGRFCAVCALGGAPAMVVFIHRDGLSGDVLRKAQEVSDQYQALQVFAVVIGVPDDALKSQLRQIAAQKNLRIPLTLLPGGEIPAGLPIDRDAGNNVLFYHGQRPFAHYADYDFLDFHLESDDVPRTKVAFEAAEGLSTKEMEAKEAPPLEAAASSMLAGLGLLQPGEGNTAAAFEAIRGA